MGRKLLYYHREKKSYIVLTLTDTVAYEECNDTRRRYLRDTYEMPSYRGYKLIGALK